MKMPDKAQRQRIGSKATALLRGFLRVTEKVIRVSISIVVPLVIAIYKTIQLFARASQETNNKQTSYNDTFGPPVRFEDHYSINGFLSPDGEYHSHWEPGFTKVK